MHYVCAEDDHIVLESLRLRGDPGTGIDTVTVVSPTGASTCNGYIPFFTPAGRSVRRRMPRYKHGVQRTKSSRVSRLSVLIVSDRVVVIEELGVPSVVSGYCGPTGVAEQCRPSKQHSRNRL